MPLTIKKKGSQYMVTDPNGKNFGTHKTKQEAIDQIAAIEMSKKRQGKSGLDLKAESNFEALATELGVKHAQSAEQPPIVIVSDGTPEGTMLMINGQPVAAKRISMYCSRDEDYPHCDLSITVEQSDEGGLLVERTLTLRKAPPPVEPCC